MTKQHYDRYTQFITGLYIFSTVEKENTTRHDQTRLVLFSFGTKKKLKEAGGRRRLN